MPLYLDNSFVFDYHPNGIKRCYMLQAPSKHGYDFDAQFSIPLHQKRLPLYIANSALERCFEGFHFERPSTHWFKCLAILLVTRGSVAVKQDGNPFQAGAHDAILLHPGKHNQWQTGKDGYFHCRIVEMDGPCLNEILEQTKLAHHVVVPLRDPRRIVGLFKQVVALSSLRPDGYIQDLSSLAYSILMGLSKEIDEEALPPEIKNTLAFMRRNVESELTNARIAAEACKSVSRLSVLFRKHLDMSPIECFIRMKMDHAKVLLVQTHDPIGRIAERLGYEDTAYFSRLFRKHAGMSAREYRKSSGPSPGASKGA